MNMKYLGCTVDCYANSFTQTQDHYHIWNAGVIINTDKHWSDYYYYVLHRIPVLKLGPTAGGRERKR